MFKNRRNKSKKQSRLGIILINHIMNNKRGYLIVGILFFIGLIVGVFFVNSIDDLKLEEINSYFNNLIEKIKTSENINFLELFKSSVVSNFITIILLCPAFICAFLVMPVPYYHNMMIIVVEAYEFLTKELPKFNGKFTDKDMFFKFYTDYKEKHLNIGRLGFYILRKKYAYETFITIIKTFGPTAHNAGLQTRTRERQ